jgi:hypothetical protein
MKKAWLSGQFESGYVFEMLDERAKVFIEYGPVESSWVPVDADDYMMLGCFWVSGKYKASGHGKNLLASAIKEAKDQNKKGLLALVGKKKFHFMSDGKWLIRQGFEVVDENESGFQLLAYSLTPSENPPRFKSSVKTGLIEGEEDLVVYYSSKCPFTDHHVKVSLKETMEKRKISYRIHYIDSKDKAMACPSPNTIFSVFYKNKFLTTDLSICMDSRFDKALDRYLKQRDA